jgi:conjugative transfer region protein TrbK
MEGKTLARIGAVVFVAGAFTIGAIELTQTEQPANDGAARQVESPNTDPLRAELMRCQRLGEAGPHDGACLIAWANARARFLNAGAKSVAREPDQLQHNMTVYKQPAADSSISQQDEGQ